MKARCPKPHPFPSRDRSPLPRRFQTVRCPRQIQTERAKSARLPIRAGARSPVSSDRPPPHRPLAPHPAKPSVAGNAARHSIRPHPDHRPSKAPATLPVRYPCFRSNTRARHHGPCRHLPPRRPHQRKSQPADHPAPLRLCARSTNALPHSCPHPSTSRDCSETPDRAAHPMPRHRRGPYRSSAPHKARPWGC